MVVNPKLNARVLLKKEQRGRKDRPTPRDMCDELTLRVTTAVTSTPVM